MTTTSPSEPLTPTSPAQLPHSLPGPRRRECNPQLFPHKTNDSLTSAAHYRGNSVSVVFLITRKPMLLLLFIIYVTR